MDNYIEYIERFSKTSDPFIKMIEAYAVEQHVPIMDRAGIDTFISLLRIQQPKRLLEIGSAIGYSAIRIADALPEIAIVTIERDVERYTKAVEYIGLRNLQDRISIIEGDALLLESSEQLTAQYDALFIDAAKGQYQRFFEKYAPFVVPGGIIYCDNMFMHGAVLQEDEELPKRNRTMIRNLKRFTEWILTNQEYESSLLPVGDGILIAVKK
jgi:predicted O-methyltransferase YrrM